MEASRRRSRGCGCIRNRRGYSTASPNGLADGSMLWRRHTRREMFLVTEEDRSAPGLQTSPEIDTTVSHSARIWDYWLGGHDNYPVDRKVGDQIAQMLPDIVAQARANRMFLGRALRYLAGEAGIRQFLDIGSGLPAADNTHEVTQRVAPECR